MSETNLDVAAWLRGVRRRVAFQTAWLHAGTAALVGLAMAVLLSALERWTGARQGALVAGASAGLAAAIWAALVFFKRKPTLMQLAELLDRRGGTKDRLTTGLALSAAPATPMATLALADCRAYAATFEARRLLPWRPTTAWRWLAVPLVALGLVQWDLHRTAAERARLAEAGQTEVAPTADALQRLAKELARKADEKDDPVLKKAAEEVAKRAEALRMAAIDPAAAEKARLSELSALEQMARELQRPPTGAFTPQELKALAAAMQKAEATRAAGEKLQAGENAAAAQELERVEKSEQQGAQAEKALRQALEQLAQQKQISEAAQQQMGGATEGASASTLQRLAELLKKGPSTTGSQAGRPGQSSPQDLQNLLAALENLKAGQQGEQQSGKAMAALSAQPPANGQPGPSAMTGAQSAMAQAPIPGAHPNGARDTGTTDTPFGSKQPSAPKGADLALRGAQSESGENFSQSLPAAAEASKASRKYKELYEALAPAMENAVVQEEIPLGSRLYIKRYFESIRPEN